MPAMLDDPTAPPIYRLSGQQPFPMPSGPLPAEIELRQVILRDRVTIATLIPFSSPAEVPHKLTAYLCDLLGREIEKGDTYPMVDPLPLSYFGPYWFSNFGAVMVLGDIQSRDELQGMEEHGADWARQCLGSFYVKPNYPGRSSHVCNGGFLVSDAARNRGVGRLMGECYLDWAPKLGYTYSVFNLVYETNVASLRIWDALGFKRIGRVKGCGNLKSFPDQFIDAIIFGRELGGEHDESMAEERFDKIRFYLRTGAYPAGSDRAEKSRLRSAATHYRLLPNIDGSSGAHAGEEILMLKGKEVISDPNRQYEIARSVHIKNHGGINKTTASIADKYHWVRIKETVSAAIRNCPECKESPTGVKVPTSQTPGRGKRRRSDSSTSGQDVRSIRSSSEMAQPPPTTATATAAAAVAAQQPPHAANSVTNAASDGHASDMQYAYGSMPVDPQIMAHQWPSQTNGDVPISGPSATDTRGNNDSSGVHGDTTASPEPDVGARLRVELEAQMLQGAAAAAAAVPHG